MNDDAQLLRQYVETGSEPAFRELVERHIQMVNATARRMIAGDTHLAQDVTQLVFTDLARKAATLPTDVVLGGWLHRHTCFTAAKAVRTEIRRRTRERTAMELNAVNDSTGASVHWAQVAPVLDDALNRLDAPDRDALVLRFLQQQDLRSVGRALGTSDDTAQKRVTRALEKLRAVLSRRGVAVTSTALLATSLEAAPFTPVAPGLAALVSAHALSTAAVAGTGLTLLSIKTMITSKLALGLAATVAIAGTTAILVTHSENNPAPAPISNAPAPVAANPGSSKSVPAIFSANKVEAPKAAPAPAGDKPATPDDLAASPGLVAGVITNRLITMGVAGVDSNSAGSTTMQTTSVQRDGTIVSYSTAGGATFSPGANVVFNAGGGGSPSAGMNIVSNGSSGSVSRQVSIVNGQMITTTTKDGITSTKITTAPPSGAIVAGSSPGEPDTMIIVDQNGVAHTVPVPKLNGPMGSGAVLITTSPDGTTNTLQVTPSPDSP